LLNLLSEILVTDSMLHGNISKFTKHLESSLQNALPGRGAHYEMSRFGRPMDAPHNARRAAVLILLYPANNDFNIVLIKRTSRYPSDVHSGQVSLPGGSHDIADADLSFTAIRETEEEIGIPKNDIKLIGNLTSLYIPVSKFLVEPFIGVADYRPSFKVQESEVEYIIEMPITQLLDQNNLQQTDIKVSSELVLKEVPFFNISEHIVWGATAMILNEFRMVLAKYV